ncbi:MAG: sterol carrier family protein [Microbacteriaceae bacterium]|nr:sterol carrier family protein [Microbacteriaceae bacterium]MCL2793741.1 sterol carrier family protein [Microbacteriaceae bacterium]
MAKKGIDDQAGFAAVRAALADATPSRDVLATAVRYLLQLLAEKAPGHTVEVRVPPFGAVQVVEGPRHTRGTPPNVIETDAATWVALASGRLSWESAAAASLVSASGTRATLDDLLPVLPHSFALGE